MEERAELAQAIWDSIPSEDEARLLPLYDWQKAALADALEEYKRHPETSAPWEEVKARLWPRV